MIIAISSGKGGTGKTTVAVSLALSLAHEGANGSLRPLLVDCDVEEPNAGLFLRPAIVDHRHVIQPIPEVNPKACDLCHRCAEVCAYNAIAVVGGQVLVFKEMCHGCGSCTLNCPTQAIREVNDTKGLLERGRAGAIDFARGTLNIGVAMPVPAVHQLKQWVLPQHRTEKNHGPIILDAPPGTACPVVETIRDADFVLLVTEPTPFGLHDLRMAVEVARDELDLPVGVIVNRDGIGDRGVDEYCESERIPILMRIDHDRRIAEAYSEGKPLVEAFPHYKERFQELYQSILSVTPTNELRESSYERIGQ